MAAILLSPLYIAINVYVVWRMFLWMGTWNPIFQEPIFQGIFSAVYFIFATSLVTGFLIKKPEKLHRFLKHMSNYFLGIFVYVLIPVFLAEILGMIGASVFHWKWVRASNTLMIAGTVCLLLVAVLSIYGIYNAKKIRTTFYQVQIEKKISGMDQMKIVLVADLHLGYNSGEKQIKKIVDQINRQKPDLVCIAGDLFDNEFDAVKNPDKIKEIFREIQSAYGVYACWGNHDINEPILAGFTFGSTAAQKEQNRRMEEFVQEAGIVILNDEGRLIDEKFYLLGRKDPARAKKLENGRKSPEKLLEGLDKTKPIFVMDHQPKELRKMAVAGVDLDLCGHTHGGQIFPGNIAVDMGWENAYGYLKKDRMHNIVTSGAGLWGPNMRIGTKSEICVINIEFNGKGQ